MKLKKFLLYVFFKGINLSVISNSYSIEPDVFVQSTVNRASQILVDNFSKEEKIEKLKNVAKETVDIRGIGFYALGSYRKNMSDDKKKEDEFLFFSKNFFDDQNVSIINKTIDSVDFKNKF